MTALLRHIRGGKRLGRPTKAPKSGERVPLGLRVTAATKRKLVAAAEKAGRSQSQEAEFRLEQSFERQALREIVRQELARGVRIISQHVGGPL